MKFSLFALLCLPLSVLADGGLPNQPYIYVRGSAQTEKAADIVVLRFDLVARAPEHPKANADVQARATKVFALLRERKVGDNDIIADQLRSEADFEQTEGYSRNRGKLIGYVVTRQFAIKVRDVNAFPKLVDDLISAVNAEFSGVSPELSKPEEVQNQLWDKAIADARQQAEKTAKQAGMKIDSVFAISPVSIPDIESTMFPKTDERVIVTGSNIPTKEDRVSSQYRLAPISLSQTVHIIYLISPMK